MTLNELSQAIPPVYGCHVAEAFFKINTKSFTPIPAR